MTELEWLKQESGLSDEELKAMEAVAGHTKFVGMLQKMIAGSEAATKAKTDAENERLALEKRYQEEFIPEMRKVTQDSLRAQAEAAAAKAQLEKAREYGIVPDAPASNAPAPEVRAPGSPDPNMLSRADFDNFSRSQANAIVKLNDLNAEHYKLFKEPLPDSQSLVDEVSRQHTLGHRDFTIQKAWESKFNVSQKRTEIQQAEQQKLIDEKVQAALQTERQKFGSNPGLVHGQPSRFATYKPSDSVTGGNEPWKSAAGMKKAANQPWRDKAVQKISAVA